MVKIPEDRQQFGRFEWERVLRRVDLPLPTKGIGLIMATFAGKDGDRVFPSQEQIAACAGVSTRQARTHIHRLRDLGLLTQIRRGNQYTHKADEYVLTVPVDMTALNLLSPDELTRQQHRKSASGASGIGSGGDGVSTGSSLHEHRKSGAGAPEVQCSSTGSQLPPTTSVPLMDQPKTNHVVAALSTSGVDGDDEDEELTYPIASKEVQERFGLEGALERIGQIQARGGLSVTEATIALALAVREKRQAAA